MRRTIAEHMRITNKHPLKARRLTEFVELVRRVNDGIEARASRAPRSMEEDDEEYRALSKELGRLVKPSRPYLYMLIKITSEVQIKPESSGNFANLLADAYSRMERNRGGIMWKMGSVLKEPTRSIYDALFEVEIEMLESNMRIFGSVERYRQQQEVEKMRAGVRELVRLAHIMPRLRRKLENKVKGMEGDSRVVFNSILEGVEERRRAARGLDDERYASAFLDLDFIEILRRDIGKGQ